jgi:S1-C subfamily serine protease
MLLLITTLVLGQSDAQATVKSATFTDDFQWKAVHATLRLGVRFGEGSTGSAIVIANKDQYLWALTAQHVVRESAQIEADLYQKSVYPARARTQTGVTTVERNPKIDVALVKIPIVSEPLPEVLPLIAPGLRPKHFPQSVLAVGCDDGFIPKCFEDKIQAKRLVRRPESQSAFFWETVGAPQKGRSGGGLIDAEGRVIGVCAARDGYGYYTHIDEIHAWLKPKGYSWLWENSGNK